MFKKLLFLAIPAIILGFVLAYKVEAVTPSNQGVGGTGTSTTFSLNSLILQGSGGYKGVATGTLGTVLLMQNNIPTWVATSTLGITGGGSGTPGGNYGQVQYNNAGSFAGAVALLTNGTVSGVNATSSTVSFNVQGTGTLNPFNVSSSSGTSYLFVQHNGLVGINSSTPIATLAIKGQSGSTAPFVVASSTGNISLQVDANGSTTISSLGIGSVQSTSGGSLFVTPNTGTGSNVLQTSPTLITPILGTASGTALTLSNNLWVTGQSNLSNTSSTALSVSGISYLASTSITGTLTVSGTPTLSGVANCTGASFLQISSGLFSCATPAGGGGGGSGGGWATSTTANGLAITNNVSPIAPVVGINSSTPWSNLVVQGTTASSTTPVLTVASSTGASMFQVTSRGNVNIATLTAGSILISDANKNVANSSLSQSAGTTLINGVIPIINAGGIWLSDLLQTSGTNFIVQTPTSTAVLGGTVIGGGVQYIQSTKYLSATEFCTGGLFNVSSSTAFNIYLPTLSQVGLGISPSNCTNSIYAGNMSPQFIVNSGTASVTTNASGTGETLMFAPGTGATLAPGQSYFNIGQFTATSTLLGATTTGMTLNAYLSAFQPTSTAPNTMGQILSADATGKGWQLTDLVAGTNITISTTTPNKITINSTGGGSGNSAWTIGSGLIYNATTTDAVLVGTTTPTTAKLFVQGSGTLNPFNVASSTGTALLTVAANGSTTISSLASAGCVGSTAGGQLYVTTCGGGSLSGGTNGYLTRWTSASAVSSGVSIDNGTVAGVNATSSTTSFLVQGTGSLKPFQVNSSTGTSLLTVLANGNIGIGASSPSQLLSVGASNNFTVDTSGNVVAGTINSSIHTIGPISIGSGYMNFSTPSNVFQFSGSYNNTVDYIWSSPGTNWQSDSYSSGTRGMWRFNQTFVAQSSATTTGTGALEGIRIDPTFGSGANYEYNSSNPMIGLAVAPAINVRTNSTGAYVGLLVNPTETSTGTAVSYIAQFQANSSTKMSILTTGKVGIGTTTPAATLVVQGSGSTPPFIISTSTGNIMFKIDAKGHVSSSSTVPTLASCGATPSVLGDDFGGKITVGGGTNGCYMAFAKAYTNDPACVVTNQTGSVTNTFSYTATSTAINITETGLSGSIVNYICKTTGE